ncbi:FAD-dependent oxidoreductase [Fusibacter sp. JL216-2]|uniref:FAD-dependent oxidoreductase n=1 Tax=Fusibacter sp. JL216-2 TaxID=3071453 RepID=UPI003D356430
MADQRKLLEFVNMVSNTKMGSRNGVTVDDPRFLLLEKIVTEEMAEVALALEYRVHLTAEDIASKCGKSVEKTKKLLWDLAIAGVSTVKSEDGVDKFWYETWVPGIFEMVVNNKSNVRKYPQIAKAFDDYGHLKNPLAAGNVPIGKGVMRVIPIESALDGETRRASSEEVSGYIRNARLLSVSDCSCRTSREEMGEGCGHLKEEMCIQLDDAAEYYIRTGRGREVTKEEALEIIRKAERDGLMHQIPNTEGEGHTHAICNCCGCSCYAIRAAGMYHNPDMVRSNYISQVDPENCVGCGECVDVCPTNAIKLGEKLCASLESQTPVHIDLPSDTKWGPDKWNPDYRINRKETLDTGTSPCKTTCPAHISIPGYIKLASQGRYKEALEMIKKDNPLPAVCGRICPALCESECTRGDLDDPVAIDEVKKFLAEQDMKDETRFVPEIKRDFDKKIAVIGAGPSGLSCAYYLAVEGYKVTVFEKEKELGGMLQFGIPAYRLEKDVIQAEIDILKSLGIDFKTGLEVGKDVSLQSLRDQGYKAFFIAIGAQKGRRLGLENEDALNIETGVDFLRNSALGRQKDLSGKVLVIGGGNVAIDVARSALRHGADEVEMVCLESRDKMPALEEEVHEAMEEGIKIRNGYGPFKYEVKDGKVEGVWLKKCTSVTDETGCFNPVFDEKERLCINADHVMVSVGQSIEWNELLKDTGAIVNPNNTIAVDAVTLQSSEPDIFAGGDAVTGPRFAIDAIALGKEGAVSIHRYVQRGQSLVYGRSRKDYVTFDKTRVDFGGYDHIKRERSKVNQVTDVKGNFSDPRGVYTEDLVKGETMRCLSCGVSVVDAFMCVGCGACTTRCKFDAAKLERKYNETGVDFSELKPIIVKHAMKRKVKVAVKSVKRAIKKEPC